MASTSAGRAAARGGRTRTCGRGARESGRARGRARGGVRIRARDPGVGSPGAHHGRIRPGVQREDAVGETGGEVHGAAVHAHGPGGVPGEGDELEQGGALQQVDDVVGPGPGLGGSGLSHQPDGAGGEPAAEFAHLGGGERFALAAGEGMQQHGRRFRRPVPRTRRGPVRRRAGRIRPRWRRRRERRRGPGCGPRRAGGPSRARPRGGGRTIARPPAPAGIRPPPRLPSDAPSGAAEQTLEVHREVVGRAPQFAVGPGAGGEPSPRAGKVAPGKTDDAIPGRARPPAAAPIPCSPASRCTLPGRRDGGARAAGRACTTSPRELGFTTRMRSQLESSTRRLRSGIAASLAEREPVRQHLRRPASRILSCAFSTSYSTRRIWTSWFSTS